MVPRTFTTRMGVFACSVLLGAGCSLIFSFDDNQCVTNDDCARLADTDPSFLGTSCSTEGVCVPPGGPGSGAGGQTGGCVDAVQCTADNGGIPSICSQTTGECIALLNDDCTDVVGDYTHPDAVLIGLLNSADFGPLPDQFQHISTLCVAEQVISEIESSAGGIPHPSGSGTRPVAFISCNEKPDLHAVGQHLVDVGVKLMVGVTFAADIGFETDIIIPNDILHITPTVGLAGALDLVDPNNLVVTTIPNYANLSISVGRLLEAADDWIKEDNPTITRTRVLLWAAQDPDTQMAEYGLDNNHFIFNGHPALGQDPPDPSDCPGPNGCFLYLNATQFSDAEGNVEFGDIVQAVLDFNPHVIVILDTAGEFQFFALPQLEELDTQKPDPIYILRSGDPSTTIFFAQVLDDLPPGIESRFYATNYKYPDPDLNALFRAQFGAICPAQLSLFFPPFIEFTYDAVHLAVMAYVANGNWQKHWNELSGTELSQGLFALAPVGHRDTATAVHYGIKATDLPKIYNALVQGKEVDVMGAGNDLDFELQWKSPVQDMDVACVDPASVFPNEVFYHEAGVYWDSETDTLVPGKERMYITNCFPLQL